MAEKHSRMDLLSTASARIAEAMSVIPERYLVAAMHRGFRIWPHRMPISMTGFLEPILQTVLDNARTVASAEMGALGIGRFPSEPFDPWLVSGVPEPEELRRTLRTPRPRGLLAVPAIEGKSARLRDIRQDPRFIGLPPGHPEIRNLLAIPILYDGTSLGNLYLANKVGAEEFTEEDEAAVSHLTRMAAMALQQTYLQAALDIQQTQLQEILDSVPTGVFFIDRETGNITANSAAMDMFGRPFVEERGREQYSNLVYDSSERKVPVESLPSSAALAGKTTVGMEMKLRRDDGSMMPIRVNAAPVLGMGRQILGAVVVFDNVTAERELEQLRRETAAVAAHDLRNPIQAILMNAEYLTRAAPATRRARRAAELVTENARRLDAMVDQLLDVARVESRQLLLRLEVVDVAAYLGELVPRIAAAYPANPISLHLPGEPVMANVDLLRLDQAVSNLVENGAKYSAPGGRISVSLAAEAEGFVVEVRDLGQGIEKEELVHIFDRFYRGRSGHEVRSGLGLGLFIVKGAVEAHGGVIEVESKPGEGSTFRLRFPSGLRKRAAAA